MKLKSVLDNPCGFRYFFDRLNLQSSVARQILLDSFFSQSTKEIANSYTELQEFYQVFISVDDFKFTLKSIQNKLACLKDIRGTINRIENGIVPDDIELYEIKCLALVNEDIRSLIESTYLKTVSVADLSEILNLLDPESHRITSFYVYDYYSNELKQIRELIRKDVEFNTELNYKASEIEERIRKELCSKLIPYAQMMRDSIATLSIIDILIARSEQIKELGLCIPEISKEKTSYSLLFNPEIEEIISKEGRLYQNVDICFEPSMPVLITGANMGGKTVVLKTLALCQYLFQFGFGIPAKQAKIAPVSDVCFCIGDLQSVSSGLSSFAAEMERIDKVITAVKNGKNILALIDEPARTTNPTEGTALVTALIRILYGKHFRMVITSHYNIENVTCKRLRVRGYISGSMNYELIEDNNSKAPQEALQIASSLGIDKEWIEEAGKLVNQIISK